MTLQVNFYQKIKALSEKWNANLEQFLENYSSEKVLIILFGSRSREDFNFLSDYDIVMITENYLEKPVVNFPCELFIYSLAEAIELLKKDNFILKNALLNGKVLINNINKIDMLQSLIIE